MADIPVTLTNAGAALFAAAHAASTNVPLDSWEVGEARRTPTGSETAIVTPANPVVTGNTVQGTSSDADLQIQIVDGAARSYRASEIGIFSSKALSGGSIVNGKTLVFYGSDTTIIASKETDQRLSFSFFLTQTSRNLTTYTFTQPIALPIGTKTVLGRLRLATDSEIDGGTNDETAVTPRGVLRRITSSLSAFFATAQETITGTISNKAVTPAGLRALTATTARNGLARLASTSQARAGTSTTLVVTPSGMRAYVTGLNASATGAGIVELSTDAELRAGTLTNRAVTPANIGSLFTVSTRAPTNSDGDDGDFWFQREA